VLIETTGLADPVPIVQTVVTDEKLAPTYMLDSVITLVDGVNGLQQLETQPESVKQAALADRLLITKTDLPEATAVASLTDRLAVLNPGAEVLHVAHGVVSASALFGAALAPESRAADLQRWLREEQYVRVEAGQSPIGAMSAPHDPGIRSYSILLDEPLTAAGLTAWLTAIASLRGAELLRVKGLLNVDGEPVAVHAVQTLIHEPVTLAQWPDAERRSRLVFITRGMDRAALESTLDVLRWRSMATAGGVPKPDPQAYARFLAAMEKMR
jgi:G3E family GTPase